MPKPSPKNPPQKETPKDRPAKIVMTMMEIGAFVAELRRIFAVRQADLARRAHVSRQWIVALEQGKPTLEASLVLRTLETLGFEVELKPYDPIPPWILRAIEDGNKRRASEQLRRNLRRRTQRRENARADRRAANHPRVVVDVE